MRVQRFEEETMEAERIANLDRETAVEEISRITEALRFIRDPERLDKRLDEVDALRDEARELEDVKNGEEIDGDMEWADYLKERVESEGPDIEDTIKALREEADRLEAEIPDEVFQIKHMDDVKKLQTQLKYLRRSFGAAEAETAKLEARIEANEDMSLRALQRTTNSVKKFLKEMDGLTDEVLDRELKKLADDLDRQERLVDQGRARLEKMAQGSTEKFSIESGRQLTRQLKEMRLAAKKAGAQGLDRGQLRAMAEAKLEDTYRNVRRLNDRRAVQNAKLRDRMEGYTPDAVKRLIEERRTSYSKMVEEFETDVQKGGGGSNYNIRQEFDFREVAEEMARSLMDRITGNYTRIGQLDAVPGLRGPMKNRVLNMPYEVKQKWLELDAEKVLARYTETMAEDIELYRAYGDTSGGRAMQAIREDFDRLKERIAKSEPDPAKRAFALQTFDNAATSYLGTFEALLARARGIWGLQNARGHIGVRMGKMMLDWNVAAMMGTVTISSISDAARAVTGYGLTHTMRSSFVPFVKALVSEEDRAYVKANVDLLHSWGIGIETYAHQRTQGALDIMPADPYSSRAERLMHGAATSMPIVAGFGYWTDAMKVLTGTASIAKFSDVLHKMAHGGARQDEVTWIVSTGINENLARRIWDEMSTPEGASKIKNRLIPNTGKWKDRQAARAFEAAVAGESNRLIISPGLEKPLWTDGTMPGRLISQFRGFMFSSNTKATVALLQARDGHTMLRHFNGFMASAALGMASYYLWALTSGEDAREEMRNASWGQWADQALMRGGYLGVIGEAVNVGSAIPWAAPYTTFGNEQIAGRRADNLAGALLGPTFGRTWDILELVQSMDEPTEGFVNQARKMVPYQNVFYLKSIFEAIETGVVNAFNLPERRGQ
jgi:hypothetical protein